MEMLHVSAKTTSNLSHEHHVHVITGNLNIIHNREIRKLLVKGLREKQLLNVTKAY